MFKHIPILVSMFSKFPGTTTSTVFTAQTWYVHGTYCIDLLLISGWWFQRCYALCWRGGDTNNIFVWNILKLGILLGRGVLAVQECINIAGNKSSDSRGFAKGLNAKAKLISARRPQGCRSPIETRSAREIPDGWKTTIPLKSPEIGHDLSAGKTQIPWKLPAKAASISSFHGVTSAWAQANAQWNVCWFMFTHLIIDLSLSTITPSQLS